MPKSHRRDFLKHCGAIGLAAQFSGIASVLGCSESSTGPEGSFEGRVHIVGAGAAGLSTGYLLAQQGVDFRILEAAPTYGGRIKRNDTFADFPIPLGGEWLHEQPGELQAIVNDDNVQVTTVLQAYDPGESFGFVNEAGELTFDDLGDLLDLKFIGATWLDFFDEYIVPSVRERIQFNTPVTRIDYSGDVIVLTDANGQLHETDRVVVTAPLQVLKENSIVFDPPLPTSKRAAIDEAVVWGGMKVFMEFREPFYPTALAFSGRNNSEGQHLYYDAAYGQNTGEHVLGLFTVGSPAEPYQMRTGDALRDYMLAELDAVFDGAATRHYIKHIEQNWNAEPFIKQAYLYDFSDPAIPAALWEPIDDRVFFAGDAYTRHDDWSAVDDAARSARDTVSLILT